MSGAAATAAASGGKKRSCSTCGVAKNKKGYSSSQWKKGTLNARCLQCVVAGVKKPLVGQDDTNGQDEEAPVVIHGDIHEMVPNVEIVERALQLDRLAAQNRREQEANAEINRRNAQMDDFTQEAQATVDNVNMHAGVIEREIAAKQAKNIELQRRVAELKAKVARMRGNK